MLAAVAVAAIFIHCLHSGVCYSPRVGAFLGITDAFQRQSVGQGILNVMCIPFASSFYLAVSVLEEEGK